MRGFLPELLQDQKTTRWPRHLVSSPGDQNHSWLSSTLGSARCSISQSPSECRWSRSCRRQSNRPRLVQRDPFRPVKNIIKHFFGVTDRFISNDCKTLIHYLKYLTRLKILLVYKFIDCLKPSIQISLLISVTRRLDYMFNIWSFIASSICPIA